MACRFRKGSDSLTCRATVTIETPRLLLRPHEAADFVDCAAMWGDPAVVRFIGEGAPHTQEAVWARLLRYAGCWQLCGYGYWAVREKASGRFVGDVGFQDLRRASEPALPAWPEIGWVLATSAQGQGYACEAVTAAIAWVDASLTAEATMCIIHPGHHRSIRIAEAAGYRSAGSTRLAGRTVGVFSRSRGFQSRAAITTS